MKDESLIKTVLQKGREAKEKVSREFADISLEQLNWKPSPGNWSIAQCLEHLIVSDSSYFPVLKKITEGTYQMKFWEKHSPFSSLWGRFFKDQLQEQVKRKMKAPKIFKPRIRKFDIGIIDRYHNNLNTFLSLISDCQNTDLDKTIIPSPVTRIVTYSLRDVLTFLVQHEHRHINQAIRLKANEDFPRGM